MLPLLLCILIEHPSCTKRKNSLSSPASGLGSGTIIITIIYKKILALRPTPLSSLSHSDSGPCGGRTEPNWRPHHRDSGWASRTIHKITASALQKWIIKRKKDCKNDLYLHTDRLFSHSVYSREVDVCWIILYGWMLGFCLFFYKSYTVFGILCSPILWKWPIVEVWIHRLNVTVEVVLHLLGSMLWPTFKYFVFSKMKRKKKD